MRIIEKRKNCSEQEEALLCRIEQEHDLFYYRMISESPKVVYEKCGIIKFYECIFEYFLYCENIKPEIIETCLQEDNVLSSLYELYLKHESLRADTWSEIETLLDEFRNFMDDRVKKAYRSFGLSIDSEGGEQ